MALDLEVIRDLRRGSSWWSAGGTSLSSSEPASPSSPDPPGLRFGRVFHQRDALCDDAHTLLRPHHVHLAAAENEHDSVPLSTVLPTISIDQRWTCVRQLIVGLLFLHTEGYSHGSISIESAIAVRDPVEGGTYESEEGDDGSSAWVFRMLLPSQLLSFDKDKVQADAVAFAKLALEVLDLPSDDGHADALWQSCSKQVALLQSLARGGDTESVSVIDESIVESILGVEKVWCPLLDHAIAQHVLHHGLSQISEREGKASDLNSSPASFGNALQWDPFLLPARFLFELAAWRNSYSIPSPRNAIMSIFRADGHAPHASGELAFSLLRAGWVAESWAFSRCSLQKLDAWEGDWQRLALRISEPEAEDLASHHTREIFKSLAELLHRAKRIHEGSGRLLRRALESCSCEAIDKLSRFPFWPILLPPGTAIEAARVAHQRSFLRPTGSVEVMLWHLAATMQNNTKPPDALTHLICSSPTKHSSLGMHVVQPSGIIIWSEGNSSNSAIDPSLESSPFSAQLGGSCGLLLQQRLMIFANCVTGDNGYTWDTYALRFGHHGGGITHSALIEGYPAVLLVIRADNSFDRFVLQGEPQTTQASSPKGPSAFFLLNLMTSARSSKNNKEAIVSSSIALDSLLLGLHSPAAQTGISPKPLGLISVSDGSQFLIPLLFGGTDLRVLVLEHLSQPLGYTQPPTRFSNAPTEIYLRAQQLHVLSISKLPLVPAPRKTDFDDQPSLISQHLADQGVRLSRKLDVQSKFATAVKVGLVSDGGLKGFVTATALSSHLSAKMASPAAPVTPTLTAESACFFLPHIWEMVLCLEDQLFWWTLPYPLRERAVTYADAGGESLLAEGTAVHYRVELPFLASHWQLISQKTRLIALVRKGMGSTSSLPNSLAVLDAWYGDILRLIPLPEALLGSIRHVPNVGSKSDWQPAYRLSVSNKRVVVAIGGRASFWTVHDLVVKGDIGRSQQKMKNAVKRATLFRGLVPNRRETDVVLEHHVISSGGRDGWCRPEEPKKAREPPAETKDIQCLDWRECLLLSEFSIWSAGSSLHVTFHEDVNLVHYPVKAEGRKIVSIGPKSTWVAVRRDSEASTSLNSTVQSLQATESKDVTNSLATSAMKLMQKTRIPQSVSSIRALTMTLVEAPGFHDMGEHGAHADDRMTKAVAQNMEAKPGHFRRRAMRPTELVHDAISHGALDVESTSKSKLWERIMRYNQMEHAPSATWLVEAFSVATSALREIRRLLHPPSPEFYVIIASALEACCRVAAPLRHALNKDLQEAQRFLAECVGCMGAKAWATLSVVRDSSSSGGSPAASTDRISNHAMNFGADLRSAMVIGSSELPTRVAALALDTHGKMLLLVVEGHGKPDRLGDKWMIEFWRSAGRMGTWDRAHSACAHNSAANPCCALSESAVIGFTAAECIIAWDSDDAEQLFCLKWANAAVAVDVWCSGDGARVAISTGTIIYYWKDRVLSQSIDCRAIMTLCEQQGKHHTAGIDEQHRITSAHCAFGTDGSSVLGAAVDSRWLAIMYFMHQSVATNSAAFTLTSPHQDILDIWISVSGVSLILFPEKLEIWTLPYRAQTKRAKRQSVNKEQDAVDVISRGQVLHIPIEEAFESLAGGPPEVVVSVAASKKWLRSAVDILPVQRFLAFNEYSRCLLCWDAGASAAVAFVLPTSHGASGILEPQWVTTLPAFGSLGIAAAIAAHGDTVLIGANTKWTLWSFSVDICKAIMTSSTPTSVDEPDASHRPVTKRRQRQQRSKHVTINNKRQAALDCAQARELLESSSSSKWFGSAVQPPILPASTGRYLRPSSRWLTMAKARTHGRSRGGKKTETRNEEPQQATKGTPQATDRDLKFEEIEATESHILPQEGVSAQKPGLENQRPPRTPAKKRWSTVAEKFGFGGQESGAEDNFKTCGAEDNFDEDNQDEDGEVAQILAANRLRDAQIRSTSASSHCRSPPLSCTTCQRLEPPSPIQKENPCTIFAGHSQTPRHDDNPPRETNLQRSVFSRLGISPVPQRRRTSPEGARAASDTISSSKSSRAPSPSTVRSEKATPASAASTRAEGRIDGDWREQLLSARISDSREEVAQKNGGGFHPSFEIGTEKPRFTEYVGRDGRVASPASFPPACISSQLRTGALGRKIRYYPRVTQS